MTKSNAPERIWATGNGETGSWNSTEGRMKTHLPDGWQTEYLRADLALAPREKADIHGIANEIFGAIVWGAKQPPPPYGAAYPRYTRYGNSDAETEARVIAARILAALAPPEKGPDHD